MYANDFMVLQLVSLLKKSNIRKIVVSPGSRHNILINSLEYDRFFQLYSVVDERSAGFFALGLIQNSGEPVVVVCSSGTACMNYGSAIVEAFYQRLPLLVISSDRIPELLNQNEDQMYKQSTTFVDCTKYQCQLPVVKNEIDKWYCNRLINEAIIELNHHGRGPVHINIPFAFHHGVKFDVPELPNVRKINLHQMPITDKEWSYVADRLSSKKIIILWGQSVYPLDKVQEIENEFSKRYNAVVLTDKLSNCHCPNSINNVSISLQMMKRGQICVMKPDIVISIGGNYIFNGEIKHWLKPFEIEHWQVGREDKVCDPFHKLTDIFEMPEEYFFQSLINQKRENTINTYVKDWLELSKVPTIPKMQYCEMFAITELLSNLPSNVDLHLANSQTVRMAHYVPINSDIRVYCNRGANGIDGSMSTAMGYSFDSQRPLFYITGDLSFFYDMNCLSINNISKKIRILLINNSGGAVMYDQARNTPIERLPIYLAANQNKSAEGWVKSMGFKYLSATSKEEVIDGIKVMLDLDIDQPILLEVFTNLSEDKYCIVDYIRGQDNRSLVEKINDKAKTIFKSFKM